MKRILCFLLSIALASAALGDSVRDQLIGHWRCAKENFVAEYVIKDDGTFTGGLSRDGKLLWSSAGKWTVSGKTINTELTKSSAEQIPVGTKERSAIDELTKENCRLRLPDGSTLNYRRVP